MTPCTAPATITITIDVNTTTPLDLKFTASNPSAPRLGASADGDLHFRHVTTCVQVTMLLNGPYTFYKGTQPDGVQKDALTYANDPDTAYIASGGQITNVTRNTDSNITFYYTNSRCVGTARYEYSGYRVYIAGASPSNYIGEWDPIVSNGGNNSGLMVCGAGPRVRHRYHHHSG